MEFTTIPNTDIQVSRLALGTWAIGGWMWGGTDESESVRTIHAAMDQGINLIDTASVYGFGRSEQIVGKALADRRAKAVISTKTGLNWRNEKPFRDSSPDFIKRNVEQCLKNLKTDYLDILYVHWPDPKEPFEETGRILSDMLRDGTTRAVGVSNYSPEQMDRFRQGGPIHLCQPPYNLFERDIESDLMPYCKKNQIALMTYSALSRGLLSGKMSKDRKFEGDDLRKADPKFKEPRFSQYLEAVRQLKELAREHYGKEVIHLALRWILDQGAEIAIWGGRRPEQMEPVPEVMGWTLGADMMERIDRILKDTITDPVGPEYMAPPSRDDIK